MAVALDRQPVAAHQGQRQPFVLGHRLVKLGHVPGQGVQVQVRHVFRLGPGFGLGDAEQGGERVQEVLGVFDGALQGGAVRLDGRRFQQRHLEPAAQAVQGAAQVVGDVVGDLAHAGHEALDLVEHGVEVLGQPVELVVAAAYRHPAAEVAGHDVAAGAVDAVDAAEPAAAHDDAADKAQADGQRHHPDQGVADALLQGVALLDVAADQQLEAAAQQQVPGAGMVGLDARPDRAFVGEVEPAAWPRLHRRPGVQIAGDGPAVGIGEQIQALALIAAALPDDPP